MTTITNGNTGLELKTLPESVFSDEINPPDSFYRKGKVVARGCEVDLDLDSYIIACCGHRGAGKNIWMSYLGLKAAWLYGKRLLANYPLGVIVVNRHGERHLIQAEVLDVARMLEFDQEYDNCVIAIQEAPTIINRMAAPTWKNRLLNLWLQEIRHSRSSLIYESQNEFWVDGELQWQTDLTCYMRDASRRYPGSGLQRGGVVLVSIKDKSGMWTGKPYDEWPRLHRYNLEAMPIWGCFDTHYKADIWESLRKVDLKLSKYVIDHRHEAPGASYEDIKGMATQIIDSYLESGEKGLLRKNFYSIVPELTESSKHKLANDLAKAGMRTSDRDNKTGDYYLDFSGFSREKFMLGT
jgi:hypothetical protein